MNTLNTWWCFKDALGKNTCDRILNLWKEPAAAGMVGKEEFEESQRKHYGEKEDLGELYFDLNKEECNSDVTWSNDQWIYDIVWPYLHEANEMAGWKYDITGAESMRILRYKEGGFYKLHRDGFNCHLSVYDRPQDAVYHGNVRKLSMIVLLNDDFEGGNFQLIDYKEKDYTIDTPIGSAGTIIVHPADLEHGVDIVTKGIRYTLIVWYVGPPFK